MTPVQSIDDLVLNFNINHIFAQHISSFVKEKKISNYEEIRQLIKDKPKPFVKWVGGKRQLLKQFNAMGLYPPKGFDPSKNSYFEPFVGGGAVFFDLFPKKAFLSDLNYELVVTYNEIKNNVENLINVLKKHKYEREYFLKIRKLKIDKSHTLAIASRFIYLNRTCFNGMYRVNSKGEFNVPFGKYDNPMICDEENLRKISIALQNVEITHQDYKEIIKKAKKGDFIYFDPPYHPMSETSSFTSYTKESFGAKEQLELRDTFLDLHNKGCFVMLSNSDAKFINDIYGEIKGKKVKVNKVQANRAINSKANGRGKIFEVLITNY